MSLDTKLEAIKDRVSGSIPYGPVAAVFTFFQGRATTFGILFAAMALALGVAGVYGFLHGRDLTSYASFVLSMSAMMGAIQAMVFAHSCKEDWASLRQQQIRQQNVNAVVQSENKQ